MPYIAHTAPPLRHPFSSAFICVHLRLKLFRLLRHSTVIEDGEQLGTQTPSDPRPLRWRLPDGAGDHRIAIVTEPVRHGAGDPRDLGIAVIAIGYVAP
jgi:hypothetical protein